LQQYKNTTENEREGLCTLLDENTCTNTADSPESELIHVDSGLWVRRERR
jgi:hypothetical protein